MANRFGKISNQIAAGSKLDTIPPRGEATGPKGIAVMMLGDHDDIPGPGPAEEGGPLLRVEKLCLKKRSEVRILETLSVVLPHESGSEGVAQLKPPHEPLGVVLLSRVGRDGIDPPMDEDSQLGVEEPLVLRVSPKFLPGGRGLDRLYLSLDQRGRG